LIANLKIYWYLLTLALVSIAIFIWRQGKISTHEYREKSSNQIFISYRREESADIVGRIYDRLVQHYGKQTIFKDVDSMPIGIDFRTYVSNVLDSCAVMLVVIGSQWLMIKNGADKLRLKDPKDYVRIEIESALKRKIPIIPLLVKGASMPANQLLPSTFSDLVYRNGIVIRNDPDFHVDMDRLVAGLETLFQKKI